VSTLLAVPNVSEGRNQRVIDEIAAAFDGARLLDVHSDPDHDRTVFTLAGEPGRLAGAVASGAKAAIERINLAEQTGKHPRVGAIDVAPIVYLRAGDRGAACAEALVLADLLGEAEAEDEDEVDGGLGLPVFLYGELAQGRARAELRRGGPERLARRIAEGELRPDFGPRELDPAKGAVLVAARPPLVAFNVELAPPATRADAVRIAEGIRESAPLGLTGVRAIGLWLEHREIAQVSTNVEDHLATPLARVVAAVREHATVAEAELVGLAPKAAFDGFPADIPVRNRRVLEDALAGTT
jgi:glutamate formiminotransferase/glutamate formiminotransferase/formiminotetrahydrofolate cyclodeaminase